MLVSNFISLFSILMNVVYWFLISVVNPRFHIVEKTFEINGFCLSKKEEQGFSSFDLCWKENLFGVCVCVMLMILCWGSKQIRTSSFITIFPTAIHGIAHFMQLIYGWPMKLPDGYQYLYLLFGFIFFLAMLFSVGLGRTFGSKWLLFVISSLATMVGVFALPFQYSFAYGYTILMCAGAYSGIAQEHKSQCLTCVGSFFLLLTVAEAYCEAFFCENFLIKFGGHAVFDALALVCSFNGIFDPVVNVTEFIYVKNESLVQAV